MKNVLKAFGIIAFVAVIGFSFISCGGGGDNGTVPIITTLTLPNGVTGTKYSQTLTATGDTLITWNTERNTLPDGLDLSYEGVISGTPVTAGTYTFTVTAANNKGSNEKEFSINISGWTNIRQSAIDYVITSIAYGNGMFVAGGGSQMATSTDGIK
jgi:hypothetical protein